MRATTRPLLAAADGLLAAVGQTLTVSTRETEEGWTRIVNDMRSKGADGTEEEFARVIAYLTAHLGKKEPSAGRERR